MEGLTGFAAGASSVLLTVWLHRRSAAKGEEGTLVDAAPPTPANEPAAWSPCHDQKSVNTVTEAEVQWRIDQEVAKQRTQIEAEIRAQRQATLDLHGASKKRTESLAAALTASQEAKHRVEEQLDHERSEARTLQGTVKQLQEQLRSERTQRAAEAKRKRDAEAEAALAQEQARAKAQAALAQEQARAKEMEDKYGRLFDEIDRTHDGVLSHNDFKAYVSSKDMAARLKLGIGRWQDFLAEADENGDGVISKIEFVRYFSRNNLDPVRCFGALFDAIDTDGNGRLSQHEIRSYRAHKNPWLFELLNVRDWSELTRELDMEVDGCISRDAWVSHFTNKQIGGAMAWESFAPPPTKRRRRSCLW